MVQLLVAAPALTSSVLFLWCTARGLRVMVLEMPGLLRTPRCIVLVPTRTWVIGLLFIIMVVSLSTLTRLVVRLVDIPFDVILLRSDSRPLLTL